MTKLKAQEHAASQYSYHLNHILGDVIFPGILTVYIAIDHIDYVTGSGSSSGEQYSQLGQSVSHGKMYKNCKKYTKNGQKSHIFQIILTTTKQKLLETYNLAILVDKAFCQLCVVTRNSLVQYLRCSSPNNEATSKWYCF